MIVTYVHRPLCGGCLKEMNLTPFPVRLDERDERDDVGFFCTTTGCKFKNEPIKFNIERKNSNV